MLRKVRELSIAHHCGNRPVLIWGIGACAHTIYRDLVREGGLECLGFYDNNPNGKEYCYGHKILSREELLKLDKTTPVVVATLKHPTLQDVSTELSSLGFENVFTVMNWFKFCSKVDIEKCRNIFKSAEMDIQKVYNLLADEKSKYVYEKVVEYRLTNDSKIFYDIRQLGYKQYFPVGEIFEPDENEVFIDAGCLNAATIKDLKDWTNDSYKKVYAFEPSSLDKIIVDENIEFFGYRAESVEAGLFSHNGEISFDVANCGASKISDEGDSTIKVVTLDTFMEGKDDKVTFIKMDIEGAEMDALAGAEQIICRDHPKLAISIYHKITDLWEIPLWIHEKCPGYKFYVRHHSVVNGETVLYARYDG